MNIVICEIRLRDMGPPIRALDISKALMHSAYSCLGPLVKTNRLQLVVSQFQNPCLCMIFNLRPYLRTNGSNSRRILCVTQELRLDSQAGAYLLNECLCISSYQICISFTSIMHATFEASTLYHPISRPSLRECW